MKIHRGYPHSHGTEARYRQGCRCHECEVACARAGEGRRDERLMQNGHTHRPRVGAQSRALVMGYTPATRLGPLEPINDRMLIKQLWSERRKQEIAREDAEGGTIFSH